MRGSDIKSTIIGFVNGTLCSLLVFILSAGIIQIAFLRSISDHSAFSISLVRVAVIINKRSANADKLNNLESIKIPEMFDYSALKSMSSEAKSKLEEIRPKTLSQASRISGVSPADISAMLVFMGR